MSGRQCGKCVIDADPSVRAWPAWMRQAIMHAADDMKVHIASVACVRGRTLLWIDGERVRKVAR